MHTVVVVMGVAGSGKTTVAGSLAARLGVPLAEADEFHPAANIAKMRSGVPLTDDDRWPWLAAIADWIAERGHDGGGIVTCSALKHSYRDLLAADARVFFVHLTGSRDLLAQRMRGRSGHFMPVSLLDSQLADLQPLTDTEPGVALDISASPDHLVEAAARAVAEFEGAKP
ncbi:gluconokinase [Actinokineospora baliensis]|uniref:gluconokinase n=1 Tax=Actinokineospora baliensis TaxID=547056 RepID=UPI00195DE641|nr:gluconokinase [Actinokineospora baliensis]MBM7772139.1 gluconokinase [Actinokineospora baliensis]